MSMESRTFKIPAKCNKNIQLKAIRGHFATNHSHINYYLDMTPIKYRHKEAQLVAKEMVKKYSNSKAIDTIVCLDGCEVIGAYLAEELTSAGIMSLNSYEAVNVVTPEFSSTGQMIFRDNIEPMIVDKHIILLLASATTGKTIQQSLDGIRYYGGIVEGVSALFSAVSEIEGIEVDTIYTNESVGDYETYRPGDCPFCNAQRKLDAIVNSFGYSKI